MNDDDGNGQQGTGSGSYLDSPAPGSFQSGIGVLCGWVCEAEDIKFIIDDLPPQEVGYGTERLDTEEECGDTDNGFGLLVNWNRFGDGEHTVRALADGVELGRATFTVTTLGEEFVRGVTGETIAMDFPGEGEDVRLVWQQSLQNFMIAPFEGEPMTSPQEANDWPLGVLENPGPASFQSGLGVISGWRCEAKTVEIIIDEMAPQRAAYGTERLDTAEVCGDTDNGFGLLVNWNRFGDGEHTVRSLADGVEFGRATFTVTTLGEEFVREVMGEAEVMDFSEAGRDVRLLWQQSLQNFMIAPMDPEMAGP